MKHTRALTTYEIFQMKKKLSNKDIYDAPLKVYSHNNKNEFLPPMVDVVWRRFKDGKMKILSR